MFRMYTCTRRHTAVATQPRESRGMVAKEVRDQVVPLRSSLGFWGTEP